MTVSACMELSDISQFLCRSLKACGCNISTSIRTRHTCRYSFKVICFILVQTILLVPVVPDGVLQLGSLDVVRTF